MPERDLELLRKRIEDGVQAAEELQRLLKQEERGRRRRHLRLIKGGLIGGAVLAGVEWFRDYRRTVAALAFSGLAVSGVVISERPHSPGSDPPEVIKPPASLTPSPKSTAKPKPHPPRTSPLRTLAKNSTPVAGPTSPRPKPSRTSTPSSTPTPTSTPTGRPNVTVSLTASLRPSLPLATPDLVTPTTCTINLLGIKLCPPLG